MLGAQLSDAAVDVSKAACVLLQVGLLLGASLVAYRLVTGQWPGRGGIAAFVLLAGLIVALNFFLLYTYVGALVNPRVSGGVVLVFTLLLWANIVVRAYLGTLCWIEVGLARRSD